MANGEKRAPARLLCQQRDFSLFRTNFGLNIATLGCFVCRTCRFAGIHLWLCRESAPPGPHIFRRLRIHLRRLRNGRVRRAVSRVLAVNGDCAHPVPGGAPPLLRRMSCLFLRSSCLPPRAVGPCACMDNEPGRFRLHARPLLSGDFMRPHPGNRTMALKGPQRQNTRAKSRKRAWPWRGPGAASAQVFRVQYRKLR